MIQVAGRMDQIILVGQTLRFISPTVLHVIKHLRVSLPRWSTREIGI
jgi:hypothetical protein